MTSSLDDRVKLAYQLIAQTLDSSSERLSSYSSTPRIALILKDAPLLPLMNLLAFFRVTVGWFKKMKIANHIASWEMYLMYLMWGYFLLRMLQPLAISVKMNMCARK
jgi:hypothetical protein